MSLRMITLNNIRSQPAYISNEEMETLSPEERRAIRERNPEFPPTMFMTA
jgi:hypothetical protein